MTGLVFASPGYSGIHGGIAALLKNTRRAAARSVNALMIATYWEIGQRIIEFAQGGQDWAADGEALIKRLSIDLSSRFGRGLSGRNREQMRAFYQVWLIERISPTASAKWVRPRKLQSLSAISAGTEISALLWRNAVDRSALAKAFPLPWSACVRLLSIKNEQARSVYETDSLRGGGSVRQLDRQIGSQFYERTALSRNKAAMLEKGAAADPGGALTPEQAINVPFVLELLGLKDEYSASGLEDVWIRHLANVLLERDDDCAFVGCQLCIGGSWFGVDRLFSHRWRKCFLVIDIKVGKFSYADARQMHWYLDYARESSMKPGKNQPVGLIRCAEKGASEAHYALEARPNKVLATEYQTRPLDEKLLAEELAKTRRKLEAQQIWHVGKMEEQE